MSSPRSSRQRSRLGHTEEGSTENPVVGALALLAITLALALGTIVALSSFRDETNSQELIGARASPMDLDGNGAYEWIGVTLTSGGGPYAAAHVAIELLGSDGAPAPGALLCASAVLADGACAEPFDAEATWVAGGTLFVPCFEEGPVRLSLVVRRALVLDHQRIRCEEAAG